MAPRSNWKGFLKLSLVSCSIALYPASSSSARVTFNTLNRKTGNRLKRQFVDAETGEPVESEDQIKGYPVDREHYLPIEDADLDQIRLESTHAIDIEKFVPRDEIDPRYLDTPYYIAPTERVGEEAFTVIRDAMRDEGVVGLGRVVIARRERIIMIEPWEKGLLGTTLRYAYEVRNEDAYFEEVPDLKLDKDLKEMAKVIIERKSGHFDAAEFTDRYEDAVVELVRAKQAGFKPKPSRSAPAAGNVINLMEALKRSVAEGKRTPAANPAPAAKKKAASAKHRDQPQFKLPIAGGKGKASEVSKEHGARTSEHSAKSSEHGAKSSRKKAS
ncbi:MAG: Ku protein [Hyphomicrobiales bacterium]